MADLIPGLFNKLHGLSRKGLVEARSLSFLNGTFYFVWMVTVLFCNTINS